MLNLLEQVGLRCLLMSRSWDAMHKWFNTILVLLHFSLTVKAATLIFISGCGSAISSAKEGKSGFNIIC